MAGQTIEGEVIREIKLDIDKRYATILVIAKPDEINDANMPRNLHNAAELFLRVDMVENAQRVRETTGKLLDMYAANPDGKTNVRIGKGCVCWSCGNCGLPKNDNGVDDTSNSSASSTNDDDTKKLPPGPCGNCGETEQVNYLRITRQKQDDLPWIEAPPMSEEELKKKKEAEVAATRAEVEAGVRKALEERMAAEKKDKST